MVCLSSACLANVYICCVRNLMVKGKKLTCVIPVPCMYNLSNQNSALNCWLLKTTYYKKIFSRRV